MTILSYVLNLFAKIFLIKIIIPKFSYIAVEFTLHKTYLIFFQGFNFIYFLALHPKFHIYACKIIFIFFIFIVNLIEI
jgi:hypothetical protein